MSSRVAAVPPKKVVSRGVFIGLTLTLIVLLVITITTTIIFWFLYRRTLANLQNNICPVTN